MAHHVTSKDIPAQGEKLKGSHVNKIMLISTVVFLVGAVGCFLMFNSGNHFVRDGFSYSWLFAFVYFSTLSLGGCFWVTLHHLTNSGWGVSVRRLMENLGFVFPFMALMALPILLQPSVQNDLFEWIKRHREVALLPTVSHDNHDKDHGDAEGKDEHHSSLEEEVTEMHSVEHVAYRKEEHKDEAHATTDPSDCATNSDCAKSSDCDSHCDSHYSKDPEKIAAHVAAEEAELSDAPFLVGDDLTAEALHGTHDPHDHLLYVKTFYMTSGKWMQRIVLMFLCLGGAVYIMRRVSIKQDTDPKPTVKRLIWNRKFSTLAMPIFALVVTFFAFDFVKGLDYKWFSTMYGVYFFAGCAINSMAVLILTLTWLRSKGYLQTVTSTEHYHVMGKLMHAFVIFWAYVSFSQFMLIWYANITEETSYFLLRNTESWNTWSSILVWMHFALPFALMLHHKAKKKPVLAAAAACYLLVLHILDVYIMIIPERGPSLTAAAGMDPQLFLSHDAFWGDILAFVTIGAFFLTVFLFNLRSARLYPNRDPRILESANLHN